MKKKFLVLAVIGIFLYLPSLFGPFVWDDEDFVYANQFVKEFRVERFFTSSITEGRGKGSNYFRPMQEIAYASVNKVFGFNPFWFHLLNILVHISAACAVFCFFSSLLNKIKNGAGDFSQSKGKADTAQVPVKAALDEKKSLSHFLLNQPFLISLIFLIHPIQTEAVSYISGLSDPLFVLFGFLSLIFFLLKDERKNMIPLSAFFLISSILSKETGLVFLPILLTLEFIFKEKRGLWERVKLSALYAKYHILISVTYLYYHYTFINRFDIKSAWGNNPYANSLIVRLLTFIQNLFLYFQLLIFPKDLFMERDYTIQIQTHILNPYLIVFLIVNALIIFAFWKFKSSLDVARWKLTLFCYLGFFISFIPYTGVVLINGIFYEHFLYLPMVFFFAIMLFLTANLPRRFIGLLGYCFVVLLILFAIRNFSRQLDWTDETRFYSQTLIHAPKSVRIINGLGMAQASKGDLDSAIKTYSLLIKINPNVPNAYHNMGNAYVAKGDLKKAEAYYLKALVVDPSFLFSAQSLVNLYEQTGQNEKLNELVGRYKKQ